MLETCEGMTLEAEPATARRSMSKAAPSRAHRTRAAKVSGTQRAPGLAFSPKQISAFTDHLLDLSENSISQEFEGFLSKGYPVGTLFSALLGGAAQELGVRWESDALSFAEVTLGMSTMHGLLRRFSGALAGEVPAVTGNRVVFVTPIPGEAHIFAGSLLSEYFRAAGWRVHSGIQANLKTLVATVKQNHVDVVAITVSDDDKVKDCLKLIHQMRSRSKNQDLAILVGGPPFVSDPSLHRRVGADATAIDALSALDAASGLAGA